MWFNILKQEQGQTWYTDEAGWMVGPGLDNEAYIRVRRMLIKAQDKLQLRPKIQSATGPEYTDVGIRLLGDIPIYFKTDPSVDTRGFRGEPTHFRIGEGSYPFDMNIYNREVLPHIQLNERANKVNLELISFPHYLFYDNFQEAIEYYQKVKQEVERREAIKADRAANPQKKRRGLFRR